MPWTECAGKSWIHPPQRCRDGINELISPESKNIAMLIKSVQMNQVIQGTNQGWSLDAARERGYN